MQKRHFNKKTIKQLQSDKKGAINTDDQILQEAKSFYQNLYSTLHDQPNLRNEDIFFPKNFTEGLDEQSKNECEGLLTDVECLESLKTMTSNKSPGTDGLPAEFYKVFWDYVKPFLLNALNCSYTNGHLSITQRRGLITLVPKKNKPANLLKNWRPITLLNCDYKIAAKSIANRIKKVLPKIINNDQTGFLKNRTIKKFQKSPHDRATRNRDLFQIPRFKTSTGQRTFSYRAVKLWNNLDKDVKDSKSLNSFKKALKALL